MSIYKTPFLYPKPPKIRLGMRMSYGDTPPQEPSSGSSSSEYIAYIQEFAPPIAKVIAGLTPEESVGVLKEKIVFLQRYTKIPIVGVIATQKINEYQQRVYALEKQVQAEKTKRFLIIATYAIGVIAVGGFAFNQYANFVKTTREIK